MRGVIRALLAAAARREETWERYLEQRDRHYGLERRWRDMPFWQRRAAAQDIGEHRSVA